MSQKLLSVEEIIASVKDLSDTVKAQIDLRNEEGKPDQRLLVIQRSFNQVLMNPFLNEKTDSGKPASDIGAVVKKAGAREKEIADLGGGTVIPIGTVMSGAKAPAVDNTPKVDPTVTEDEDNKFLNGLKEFSVEQLASTKFSKPAQIQIIKKLNGKGATIEVTEDDTKATLAGKIFDVLHADPTVTEDDTKA